MRIQHNILAMNAYRNYTNNTSALSKNLEKLSSGYKINRAGDDAAGLAISEKMRAQITGLEAASKNVKDGISLVKTAEGAMQEIQDMLNRMDYLATQSANGTYDDNVDRAALQSEVEQLKSEINRIADSANFNGIKLLDGSLDTKGSATKATGLERIITTLAGDNDDETKVGEKTFLDGGSVSSAKTEFNIDFGDLQIKDVEGAHKANGSQKTVATAAIGGLTLTRNASGNVSASTLQGIKNGGTISITLGSHTLSVDVSKINVATMTTTEALNEIKNAINAAVQKNNGDGQNSKAAYYSIDSLNISTTAGGGVRFTGAKYTNMKYEYETTVGVKFADKDLSIKLTGTSKDFSTNAIAKAVYKNLTQSGTKTDVTINGVKFDITDPGSGSKIQFKLHDDPPKDNIKGNFDFDVTTTTKGKFSGSHIAGTNITKGGVVAKDDQRANTVFEIKESDMVAGTVITLGNKSIRVVSADTKAEDVGANDLQLAKNETLSSFLGKLSEKFQGVTGWDVGVNDKGNGDAKMGLTVYKQTTNGTKYEKLEDLAKIFSLTSTTLKPDAKALTLQIGDTSDNYNQLAVTVGDMHTKSLGIDGLNIGLQTSAAAAVQTIRDAINQVSSVRGDLGATQNRLEHTQNNLSVMRENIQDAESTIRDTDVAEEMMSYVKNNILIQSAQAMLAQANQVPQGVLQLLG